MKRLTVFLFFLAHIAFSFAAERFIIFTGHGDALSLNNATVGCESGEHKSVRIAMDNLRCDLEKVTGVKPSVSADAPRILIGTLGCNSRIDKLVKQGLLGDLKGKTEKYVIKTIGDQLVIAGSDKRGTIFGIYEMSRQIGVSPWYYWADVPVEKHADLYAVRGEYTDGEPAVRYRGLFLNDEAPCLTSWVKNTFGTNYGDHRFYEKVYELILRLKGNFLWPAMWGWAFYADDPENSKLADDMGIIIGTSHHEPMGRNHQEWARNRRKYGEWNYQTNQKVLDKFFTEGIERIKNTDDIVTIGMRGDGDEAMSEEADTKLLERVVDNQRKIISKVTGKHASKTPQVWALYKEVLDYYDKGMRVPDDVIMLLCDDNWGNVRRVPNAKERKHKGGWGLYYHVDYVGAPRNSKWINATPTQNMWEQLTLAHQNSLDRLWILNVGDLKPMEYPITLFMDMAWNPDVIKTKSNGCEMVADVESHTREFCRMQFGDAQADEAARILNLCCKYNGRSTAEMLDAKTYNLVSGEWRKVADDYMRLEAEALRQYITLDERYRDAYNELVLFPVQAMSNLHQMYYAQAMNNYLYKNNDPEANVWADRTVEAFRRDSLLCAAYNNDIAGGKWRGMMTQKHIGYKSWNDNFRADILPKIYRIEPACGGFVFEAKDGYVAIEAGHYFSSKSSDGTSWTVIPDMGRTRGGISLMPYDKPADGAVLTYKFRLDNPATDDAELHVIVKSTLDYLNKGGLVYDVSIDGGKPQSVNFNARLNEHPDHIYSVYYPTVARRVVESKVSLGRLGKGEHTVTFAPKDPAIVLEKLVIDLGGYRPGYLFGDESPHSRP